MPEDTASDREFMAAALAEAHQAAERGEVPVGAVLVFDNQMCIRDSYQITG